MANPNQINLTASLKDVSTKGRTGEKFAIRVTGDDIVFDLDERAMAQDAANALAAQFRTNIEQGLGLDGTPLPGLASATAERRRQEAKQGARDGYPHDRYDSGDFIEKVVEKLQLPPLTRMDLNETCRNCEYARACVTKGGKKKGPMK